MSPIQAMERSYSGLRSMLRTGAFVPGARLEASKLADELGVSVTPIRDALYRLVGERMVEASIGEGFRAPRLSEADLRELYEWHSAVLTMAIRTTPAAALAMAIESPSAHEALADRAAELFERIAGAAPNAELRTAILTASDRIHPFRIEEAAAIGADDAELAEIMRIDPSQSQALRRYYLRRMRAAPDLIRRRDRT